MSITVQCKLKKLEVSVDKDDIKWLKLKVKCNLEQSDLAFIYSAPKDRFAPLFYNNLSMVDSAELAGALSSVDLRFVEPISDNVVLENQGIIGKIILTPAPVSLADAVIEFKICVRESDSLVGDMDSLLNVDIRLSIDRNQIELPLTTTIMNEVASQINSGALDRDGVKATAEVVHHPA